LEAEGYRYAIRLKPNVVLERHIALETTESHLSEVTPSAGFTRPRRYYGPVRHPRRPGLSLAGVRLEVTRLHRLGLHVLCWVSVCRHAVATTPVGPLGHVASRGVTPHFRQRRRPSPFCWRVGSHIISFGACSAFTRVTACLLARPPRRPVVSEASAVSLPLPPLR
jgi:hypothetical protein